MVRNELLKELANMSAAERILLAQDLWDSVADDPDAWDLTPQQQQELDRRLTAFQARKKQKKNSGSTWNQVKQRIRRKK